MKKFITVLGIGVVGVGVVGVVVSVAVMLMGSSVGNSALAVSNFPAAGMVSGGGAFSLVQWATQAAVCAGSGNSGPNGLGYSVCGVPLTSVGDVVMVQGLATTTWSASPGTVDVSATVYQDQGFPSGGNWSFSFYLGCAPPGGDTFTYGGVSTTSGTPPNQYNYESYTAKRVNLSGCTSGSAIQAWIQRAVDQGGASGLTPKVVAVQIVVRGS